MTDTDKHRQPQIDSQGEIDTQPKIHTLTHSQADKHPDRQKDFITRSYSPTDIPKPVRARLHLGVEKNLTPKFSHQSKLIQTHNQL